MKCENLASSKSNLEHLMLWLEKYRAQILRAPTRFQGSLFLFSPFFCLFSEVLAVHFPELLKSDLCAQLTAKALPGAIKGPVEP